MFKIVMFYQDPVVLTFAIVAIASLTRKFVRLDSVSNVQYRSSSPNTVKPPVFTGTLKEVLGNLFN